MNLKPFGLVAIGLHSHAVLFAANNAVDATVVAELEEITLVGCQSDGNDGVSNARKIEFNADTARAQGVQDLSEITRYMIDVDVPFDSGGADGLVPYLSSGNSSINIRGVEGNRIQITLDGIPQPPSFIANSFNQSAEGPGGTGRDFFDPAMYDRIDITKGSTLTQYGSGGLGGAVNLQTPAPNDFLNEAPYYLEQKLSYFDANESIAALSTAAARSGNFQVLARYSYREGKELENNGDTPANPTDFDSHALLAKVDYLISEQHTLKVALEYYEKTTETDLDSAEIDPFAAGFSNIEAFNRDKRERTRVSAEHVYIPESSVAFDHFRSLIYYQESQSELFNRQIGGISPALLLRNRRQTNTHEIDSIGFNLIADKQASTANTRHEISYGLNFESRNLENNFIRTDLATLAFPEETNNILGFAPTDSYRLGFFIDDTITFGSNDDWFFTPSFRLDYLDVDPDTSGDYLNRLEEFEGQLGIPIAPAQDYDDLSPSLALSLAHQLNHEWLLSASYTYANRTPTEEELSLLFSHGNTNAFLIIPNPDLDPETSHAFEVSADGVYPWGTLTGTAFYTLYYDYIDPSVTIRESGGGLDGISQPDNAGDVDIYGFELSTEIFLDTFDPGLDGFALGGSTGKSVGINRTDDTWINTIDPWKTVGWLAYDEPLNRRFGTRLTATYVDEKTRINNESGSDLVPSKAYFLLDWSAYYELNEHLTIYTGINNLLDRKYYKWSTLRRSVGHGDTFSDRLTEPGRNFFITAVATF